jgi:hypothetical protein
MIIAMGSYSLVVMISKKYDLGKTIEKKLLQ